jgi:predicted DsbA family dithiol-disulfide isomerase
MAAYLDSEAGVEAVRREIERASMIGVTGVPCFVFAGAYALPGAQEPEVIAQVIERAKVKLALPESAQAGADS